MERRIPEATGRKLAADMKAVFLETSAKDNHCATDLFTKSIIQIEKADGNNVDEKKNCLIS
jgi:hypothetical protein